MHTTLFSNLLTDTQLGDQGTIALDVLLHEIIEQAAALTDHLVQAAAGVVVLRVLLEVLGELSDALGEDSDLNLRRTGVAFVGAVGCDDSRLLVKRIATPIVITAIDISAKRYLTSYPISRFIPYHNP